MIPAPEILTWEIDTFAFPVFVSVIPKTLSFPTTTFPKSKLVELKLRVGVEATPVPLTVTTAGDFEALFIRESLPEAPPTFFGENTTFIVDCWPALIVIGNDTPVTLNPGTASLFFVIERSDPPVFVTVID